MQKDIKVMRYTGDNTKRGHFFKGRVYKVLIAYPKHSLLTRIFAGVVGDKLTYAKVEYHAHRKHYVAEYFSGSDFRADWRVENNGFISNASR